MKKLIILRGQSGSGKSTYIKNNFPNAFVCSADYYHLDQNGKYDWKPENIGKSHTFCKNSCLMGMINIMPLIVIDNTNTMLSEMKPYLELAQQHNYEVEIIRLVVSPEVAAKRNVHNVPEEIVRAQHARMAEIPALWGVQEEIISNE